MPDEHFSVISVDLGTQSCIVSAGDRGRLFANAGLGHLRSRSRYANDTLMKPGIGEMHCI